MGESRDFSKIDNVIENVTTLAHAIIAVYIVYILNLAITSDYDLTTLHIILLAIGVSTFSNPNILRNNPGLFQWMFFMCEGIMAISKNNVLTNTLSHRMRVTVHWVVQCMAAACVLSGCLIEIIHAEEGHYDHFSTWHGLTGLIAFVCCLPTCLNGVLALFNVKLKDFIKPNVNKFIHAICGMITFLFGGAAMIYSTQTYWFQRYASKEAQDIWYGLLIFTVIWSMVSPLITATRRINTFVK